MGLSSDPLSSVFPSVDKLKRWNFQGDYGYQKLVIWKWYESLSGLVQIGFTLFFLHTKFEVPTFGSP